MIKRDYYLNRLIHNMWNGEIKVITGIRRCGKSVLLFDLFYEYLLSQGVKEEQLSVWNLTNEETINTAIPLPSVTMWILS